jgi:hypothetical protein
LTSRGYVKRESARGRELECTQAESEAAGGQVPPDLN